MVGKQQPGMRPREPGKDEPGHQRHRKDPREQLHRRDEVAVMSLGMHVAVTGGRKRFDAEIKIVDIGVSGDVRDWLISNPVERGKNRVEGYEYQRRPRDKGRPRGRHTAMADVRPEVETKTFRNNFTIPKSDDTRLRHPLLQALEHVFRFS